MKQILAIILATLIAIPLVLADDARTTYISKGAPTFVAPAGSHCRDSASAAEYVNLSGTNTWQQIIQSTGKPLLAVTGTLTSGTCNLANSAITASSDIFLVYTGTTTNAGSLTVKTKTTGTANIVSTSGSDTSIFKALIQ